MATAGGTATGRVMERVRQLCLALPEVRETSAWGHPVFKAGTKAFAALEPVKGRESIAFRLDPVDVDLLVKRKPFFMTPYGRGFWISAWADEAPDWALIGELVESSYRAVALKRMLAALDHRGANLSTSIGRGSRSRRPQ